MAVGGSPSHRARPTQRLLPRTAGNQKPGGHDRHRRSIALIPLRSPLVLLFLLLLIAVPAALFLIPRGEEPGSIPPAQADSGAASELPLPAAPADPAATAPGRQLLGGDLLVRVEQADGSAPADAFVIVVEDGAARRLGARDGRVYLPRQGEELELAAFAAGRWSAPAELSARERARAEEVVLRPGEAAASLDVRVSGPDGRPVSAFTAVPRWAAPAGPEGGQRTGLLWSRLDPPAAGVNGLLRFVELPAGTYTLQVAADGMAGARRTIELLPGARETLVVELRAGAFLSGRVLDPAGAPLPGARAFALPGLARNLRDLVPPDQIGELAPPGGTSTSGADGRFRIGPIEAGEFDVMATAANHLPATTGKVQPLAAGATLDVGDLRLAPGRRLVLRLVQAEDGAPIAGGLVRFLPGAGDNLLASLAPWRDAPTASDPTGRVVLEALPLGPLSVEASAAGRANAAASIPAEQIGEEAFELRLGPSLTLAGLVLDARDSTPVAEAKLEVLPEGGDLFDELLAGMDRGRETPAATSDEDGRFRIEGLGPGNWRILVQADGFARQIAGPFELAVGAAPADLTILLRQGARLGVTVRDENDLPMAGVVVAANAVAGGGGAMSERTDADGRVEFAHLGAGTYQVQALPMDLEQMTGMVSGDLGGLRTISAFVELADGEQTEIVLGGRAETVTLQGYLTCGDEVADGLSVMMISIEGTRVATSDAEGFYEFDHVRAGDYLLMIGRFGFGSGAGYTEGLHVAGSGVLQHDVELPGSLLRVRVIASESGEPLAGIPVMVRREDGGQGGGFLSTDAAGQAEFRYLPPARYLVAAGRAAMPLFGGGSGRASQLTEALELGDSGSTTIELRLGPAATLRARVRDASGNPVAGAGVFVLGADGQPLTMFSLSGTNAAGELEIGSLPAGRVKVLARHTSLGQVEQEVWLAAGETRDADLVLQAGCTLRVRVVDEHGAPLSGVQAIALDARGAPVSMLIYGPEAMERGMGFLTGGEQVLGPLAPGHYRVILSDLGAKKVSHEVDVDASTPERRIDLLFPR